MSQHNLKISLKAFDKKLLTKNTDILLSLFSSTIKQPSVSSAYSQNSFFEMKQLESMRSASKLCQSKEQYSENSIKIIHYPLKKQRFTVLRSPHVDKKSREQFELRTYKATVYFPQTCGSKDISLFLQTLKNIEFIGVQIQLEWSYSTYYAKRGTRTLTS